MTSVSTDRRFGINSGAAVKVPCRCATTAAITLNGLQTIDGITVVADDRVLVKNQASSIANGIYSASTGNWSRAPDFDGKFDVKSGTLILVNGGSVNGSRSWRLTTADPVTIESSSLTFALADVGGGTPLDDAFVAVQRSETAALVTNQGVVNQSGRLINAVVDYAAPIDGTTDARTALAAFSTGAGSNGGSLPPGTYKINSNITISCPLLFDSGAILKPANAVVVTLSGPVTAAPAKIFDTSLGGTITFGTTGQAEISPEWFGALGDGSTDDAVAFNSVATIIRARAQSVSGSVQTVCPSYLRLTPGRIYKLGASINLQQVRSYGWGIVGTGAIVLATCTGKTVFDCLGSAYGTFRELTIVGSSASKPAIGIQCGRIALTANPAGGHHFDHVKMDGFFTTAGILNAAGEGNQFTNLSIHNQDATGTAFALAIDGLHHIAPITDFTASTTGIDVADSCLQHKIINCDLSVASGAPIYVSNSNQVDIDGYAVSKDAEIIRFQTGAALTTFRDLKFNLHTENAGAPGITNMVIFSRLTSGTLAVEGLSLRDHDPHATDSLIKAGTNVTSLTLRKSEIVFGGGYVGALSSGSVVIENSTRVGGLYQKEATNVFQLTNDTATSFAVPGLLPSSNMEINSDGGNVESGLVWGRANATPAMQTVALTTGTVVTLTTGALTGTTGSTGRLTVSASSDGKFYIENRTGGTRNLALRLTGQ